MEQACHQIHQGRLPCTVWPNQARDAGRNLQVHSIDAEYLSIKLGDIVKDDELIRHRIIGPMGRIGPILRPRKLLPFWITVQGKLHKRERAFPSSATTEALSKQSRGSFRRNFPCELFP